MAVMTTTSRTGPDRHPVAERVLVLSPHLDDAAWSIGSLIADLVHDGTEVLVASLFTEVDERVSSVGADWLKRSRLARNSAADTRREEDGRALAVLGARPIHVRLLDAVSRCPEQYSSSSSLVGWTAAIDPQDPGLAQCDAAVERLVRELSPTTVLVPLGHGRHVDHQIVSRTVVAAGRVLFYADFPYTVMKPFVAGDRLAELRRRGSTSVWHVPSEQAVRRHLEAALAYRSQVEATFGSATQLETQLRRHLDRNGQAAICLVESTGADDLSSTS
jgi:LmbE family N-acetylglucosaminyl deacetylase